MKKQLSFSVFALVFLLQVWPAEAALFQVFIDDGIFQPFSLTIAAGDTVEWYNDEHVLHTATSTTGVFASGMLDHEETFRFAFTEPGAFPYYCEVYPSMTGTIVVDSADGGGGGGGGNGGGALVNISNFAFDPADLTISIGDTVRWVNNDSSPHTVTATNGLFDSGNLTTGQDFTHVFTTAGDFGYACAYHSNMTGVVHVTGTATIHEIQITGFAFVPQELQIAVGDSVRWINLDSSPHTVTATDNSFDSGNLGTGQSFTRTFSVAGSYPYVCAYHSNMSGVIHVGQAGGGDTTWQELPSPTSLPLNDIRFVTSDIGWIAGDQGILRTTNGGDSWAMAGTSEDMEAVYFINTTEGWACGNSGAILHSTNGGQTWTAQVSGEVEKLRDIWFADANNGWAVGRDGILIHTSDGGQNWAPQSSPATDDLRGIQMIDSQRGWAVGSRGVVLYTDNGGANWTTQLSSPNGEEDEFEAVFALNADTAWVAGGQGRIFATFNGGATWTPQASGATSVLNDIHFAHADEGLTAGAGGYVAHGMSAGSMWHTLQPPAFVTFNGVWVESSDRQFVVTADGRIFRKGSGSFSGVEDQAPTRPSLLSLQANYPNPFNPSTTIAFTLTKQASVRLEVFDVLGRSVGILLNEQMGAGLHRVQFSGTNLSSGQYFYRLDAAGETQTRFMTLTK